MESYYAELDGMMYAHLEYIEQFDSPFLLSVRDSNKFIIDNIVNSKFNNKFDNWNINFPIYSIAKRLQQKYKMTDKQKKWLVYNYNKYIRDNELELYYQLKEAYEQADYSNEFYHKVLP